MSRGSIAIELGSCPTRCVEFLSVEQDEDNLVKTVEVDNSSGLITAEDLYSA